MTAAMSARRLVPLILLLFVSACSVRDAACGKPVPKDKVGLAPEAITGPPPDPSVKTGVTIAFLGDSLTAGLGLLSNQTFVAKLEQMFVAEGYSGLEFENAGLSADTSAGGLRRVEQVMTPDVKILVVSLGANDALRGLTVEQTRENLGQIIDFALSRGAQVMLCGMEAPTNLGDDYRTAFKQLYFDLLRSHQRQIEYIPFLLEGVGGHPELNQADGIHPNEQGAKVIAEHLFPALRKLVDRVGG